MMSEEKQVTRREQKIQRDGNSVQLDFRPFHFKSLLKMPPQASACGAVAT